MVRENYPLGKTNAAGKNGAFPKRPVPFENRAKFSPRTRQVRNSLDREMPKEWGLMVVPK